MDNVTFETQDLRVRIEDKIARIDQRKLNGEPWKEIDQSTLPIPEQWFTSPIRTSPLKVALLAFERENPGNMTLAGRTAILSQSGAMDQFNNERPRWNAQPLRFRFNRLPAFFTTTTSATTTAPKAAFGFGTGFVDVQRPAVEFSSIQFRDRTIRFRVGTHFNKSEPSWLPGIAIGDDVHALDATVRLEQRSDRSFGSSEVEVSYENILHAFSFIALT